MYVEKALSGTIIPTFQGGKTSARPGEPSILLNLLRVSVDAQNSAVFPRILFTMSEQGGCRVITLVTENSNVQPVEPPHSYHNPRELPIRVPAVSCACNRLLDLLAIKEARNNPTLCGNCGKTTSDC